MSLIDDFFNFGNSGWNKGGKVDGGFGWENTRPIIDDLADDRKPDTKIPDFGWQNG